MTESRAAPPRRVCRRVFSRSDKASVSAILEEMSGAQDAHLWRVDPRTLVDPAVHERCLRLLSHGERARHDRLAVPARRLELAAAHALLRLALADVTGTPAAAWRVRRDSMGRPLVEGPRDGMHVSITHTPGLVACLVTQARVCGVDAEQVSPRVPYMRIAEQVFSPAELQQLRELDDAARIDRFFLLWSVKEAFAKARGDGLAAPLDKVDVALGDDGRVDLVVPPKVGPGRWAVRWTRPSTEHVMATCVAAPEGEPVNIVEHVGLP
jgi:4'-phosphopantetheinyl transferase